MNGKNGEKVDHLTKDERWRRYPARPGNPDGTGCYLLQVGNRELYLDALKHDEGHTHRKVDGLTRIEMRCGLGGKVNTNPGNQNARFTGSKIRATRVIRGGEEIFVPYRKNFKLGKEIVDDERSGWEVLKGKRFDRDMG